MDEPLRVLVLDRDPAVLAAALQCLEPGFLGYSASDAASAFETASRMRISVAVIGIDADAYDARELCASLKRAYRYKPLEILLLCAKGEEDPIRGALAAGADDFMYKPLDHGEFRLRIASASLRLRSAEKNAAERDFYRKAVRQEEELSSKLLDRQMNLRETLADVVQKKRGLENQNKKLAAAARYDPLSGLLNRQSLNARLELELRKALEQDSSLCGVMLDIDRFKATNDSFGHLAGDEVLRAVGDAMRDALRKDDFAGRYGGEEFFVILPGTKLDTAIQVAERIRDRIELIRVAWTDAVITVSASLGVAEYRKGQALAEWVGDADAAMYRAKQLGRNRVEA